VIPSSASAVLMAPLTTTASSPINVQPGQILPIGTILPPATKASDSDIAINDQANLPTGTVLPEGTTLLNGTYFPNGIKLPVNIALIPNTPSIIYANAYPQLSSFSAGTIIPDGKTASFLTPLTIPGGMPIKVVDGQVLPVGTIMPGSNTPITTALKITTSQNLETGTVLPEGVAFAAGTIFPNGFIVPKGNSFTVITNPYVATERSEWSVGSIIGTTVGLLFVAHMIATPVIAKIQAKIQASKEAKLAAEQNPTAENKTAAAKAEKAVEVAQKDSLKTAAADTNKTAEQPTGDAPVTTTEKNLLTEISNESLTLEAQPIKQQFETQVDTQVDTQFEFADFPVPEFAEGYGTDGLLEQAQPSYEDAMQMETTMEAPLEEPLMENGAYEPVTEAVYQANPFG